MVDNLEEVMIVVWINVDEDVIVGCGKMRLEELGNKVERLC